MSHFATQAKSQVTCKTHYLDDFKCDFPTLYPYYIYHHYIQKCKEAIQKKTLERFLQHTQLVRESYSSSIKISLQSLLFSLSRCYILKGDLYPNTTHTYSKCKECFRDWEAFEICQKKPMRLSDTIERYREIWEAGEDKTPRIQLVARARRAQVLWVDQA